MRVSASDSLFFCASRQTRQARASLSAARLVRRKDACDHAKSAAMCEKRALILALRDVGTSPSFCRTSQNAILTLWKIAKRPREDGPAHRSFYPALENQANFSRRMPSTLRNFGEKIGVHTCPQPSTFQWSISSRHVSKRVCNSEPTRLKPKSRAAARMMS